MRERAASAAVFVPVLAIAFAVGRPAIVIVVALAVLGAAIEVFRLLRSAGYPTLPGLGTVFAIALVADAVLPGDLTLGGPLLVAAGLVIVALGAFLRSDPHDGFGAWLATTFGAVYVAQLAFVLWLGRVVPALPPGAPLSGLGAERAWVLLLVLGVWTFDTGAYLVGGRIGGPRFMTHVSPSKTYAGLVGGTIAAIVVVALVLGAIGEWPPAALLLGPLIAAAAQAGDLAKSMLKRAAGVKDSGDLIPGHGGVLDRIDSFLFAAPVVVLYVTAAFH